MSSDPQQNNPTSDSPQPVSRPGRTDGVDISELAQRVASLSAELERITKESGASHEHASNTSVPARVTPKPEDLQPSATTPPSNTPSASAQEPAHHTPSAVKGPSISPAHRNSASREGANLSSLKQRVIESSTFGSPIQPVAEEPFDPLDLTQQPERTSNANSNALASQPALQRTQNPARPSSASNIIPPEHTPSTSEPQRNPQENPRVPSGIMPAPSPASSEVPDDPVQKNTHPQPEPTIQPKVQTAPAVISREPAPLITSPAQEKQPVPVTRPEGPAHEFFDTIEWHARNEEAQKSIQAQSLPYPVPDPLRASTLPQTPHASPSTQKTDNNMLPQTDEASPQLRTDATSLPTHKQRSSSNDQMTARSAPSPIVHENDFASLTGSDHSGVEFVEQVESDEPEPLAKETADAREALEKQRHSIEGVRTAPALTHAPITKNSPPASQTEAPPPIRPLSTAEISPLTGHMVEPETKEPIPSTLKPIRTFQDDIAQRVQTRDTSIVSIASAEQDRQHESLKEKERELKKKKRHANGESAGLGTYVKIGLSGLFIGVSIAGLAFFGYLFLQPNDAVIVDTLPEYIFSDEQTRVDVTGQARREFMNTLVAEKEKVSLRLGAISYLYLTLTTRLPEGGERINLLSSTEFFERIEANVSGSLTRSLEPMMMFGVHVFDRNPPFLIFKVNFYENAFAGMLQWEPDMQVDLAPLFGPALLIQKTAPEMPPESIEPSSASLGQFTDEIVRNKEVRVLRNSDDKIVLLYGFVDKKTLVITTNEFTFAEIVTRLSSRRF